MAHQLLTYATDKKDDGYSSCAFQKEFTDDTVMEEAQLALEYSEETIIRLQRYVMDFLDIK
ncbi:MAG: hypothetical protein H6767_01810 [Candidatus Peribacteria bacterium]|nr:MAG: hypothetical protein H6767_01810 [Candidatus Peribacteria bacterium]